MSFWLVAITGLISSYIAWRIEGMSRALWFRWGGLALFVGLVVLLRYEIRNSSPVEMLPLVVIAAVTCLCWAPFIAFFFTHALVGLARSAVSLDDIKVPPGYSQAEAAAAQNDYRKALRLYHQVALEHPEEPEPHRRMGELFLLLNLPDDAIASFQDAQNRHQDACDQLPVVFRISEILADHKKDVRGAIQVIEDFLSQHPEVEGRAFAEERLRKLRARTAEGIPAERQDPK